MARQGEILDVLSEAFGPYPYSTVGAIVDNQDDLFFALETQTRPVYSKYFWLDGDGNPGPRTTVLLCTSSPTSGSATTSRWPAGRTSGSTRASRPMPSGCGPSTRESATTQEIFLDIYEDIPADDPFWDVVIGDPTVEFLFDNAVYFRGAMTVQALRNEVGDDAFWRIVRKWAAQRDEHGTTPEFIALAERISGQQLDDLFDVWLFTGEKPASPVPQQRPGRHRLRSTAMPLPSHSNGWPG